VSSRRSGLGSTDRSDNLQAYDAVLCAREKWSNFNEADNLEARRLYEQAVALDPDYARAYVGLAWTYLIERYEGWGPAPEEAIIRAQEQVAKAPCR